MCKQHKHHADISYMIMTNKIKINRYRNKVCILKFNTVYVE